MPVTCLNQNKTRDKLQRSVTFIYLILSLPRNVNESHSKSLVSGKSHNTPHTPQNINTTQQTH